MAAELATGDVIAGFALTEPDAGSDAAAIRATRDAADGYVLNGRKQWCTNGRYAGVVMAMFRTGGAGASGISRISGRAATPGIAVESVTEKLGIHTSNTVRSRIRRRAACGADALLGAEGPDFGSDRQR